MKFGRCALLAIFSLIVSCTPLSSPHSAYQTEQAALNHSLNSHDIDFATWMNRSDEILRIHYRGDFRIESFIVERRKLLGLYKSENLSKESLERTLRAKFEPIREEREARYYAELPVTDDKVLVDNLQSSAILLNSIGNLIHVLR